MGADFFVIAISFGGWSYVYARWRFDGGRTIGVLARSLLFY
jgi:hypothetical protein